MKLLKVLFFAVIFFGMANEVVAQKGKRTATKRQTTRKTTKTKTKAKIGQGKQDTVNVAVAAPAPAAVDSLPIEQVKKSLRPDEAVETKDIKDRTPLAYEHLRADDAVFRHKIWREIDTREKINLPFRYAANENNGNQRFISILLKAVQDDVVTVFDPIDDRFTTPLLKADIAKKLGGGGDSVAHYDANGVIDYYTWKARDINLDSFYKFKIKEEVIFDKESSRLFWRILGIAPIRNVYNSLGDYIGTQDVFWVYYPDMRPTFAKYEVYNGKNFGARMSWEELFESRMFYGRIVKSTINNPYDVEIQYFPGMKDNKILQLLEGENIKETIFNYEQDLWSY
jgi:gliding motility associated protien GldN